VTHVIQYELPQTPEAYVHRIGRTARAGAAGVAISFCADDERTLLRDIQKLTRITIPSFDRRNDKQLGAATAVQPAIAAAEQPLPQAKDRSGRPQQKGRPGGHRGGSQGRPSGDGASGAHGHGHAKPSANGDRRRRGGQGGGGQGGGGQRTAEAAPRWDPMKA
jgi:ATP-dependent RNA helicase RhlE